LNESELSSNQTMMIRKTKVGSSIHTKGLRGLRSSTDEKVVGLKDYGLDRATSRDVSSATTEAPATTMEDMEEKARAQADDNPFTLMSLSVIAALKVMFFYLGRWR
jgi:hypothetical protein